MRRLFYVAVTRARDFVVLSGRAARKDESCGPGSTRWRRKRWSGSVEDRSRPGYGAGALASGSARRPFGAGRARGAEHSDVRSTDSRRAAGAGVHLGPGDAARGTRPCARAVPAPARLRLEERPDPEHPLPILSASPTAPRPRWERSPTGCGGRAAAARSGRRREELERVLALEGEDPAAHAEVVDAACAFLDSPLGQRMAAAKRAGSGAKSRSRCGCRARERRRSWCGADRRVARRRGVTVVDYKLSQARDTVRYAAQLDAYALAAHELPRRRRGRCGRGSCSCARRARRSSSMRLVVRRRRAPTCWTRRKPSRTDAHWTVAVDRPRAVPRDRLRLRPPLPPRRQRLIG